MGGDSNTATRDLGSRFTFPRKSTVTSFAAQRIQVISQRIMTRTNLVKIMDEYGLYKDDRKRKTIEEVLGKIADGVPTDYEANLVINLSC